MTAQFEKFAETYLSVTLRGGREWMCVCPLHDDRGASLQFNVEKGLWVCFGCQQGGSAKSLARRLDVSFEDPALDTLELRKRLNDAVKHKEKHRPEPLPESYLTRFGIQTHDYWFKRGFTEETIDIWDLGYDFIEDQLTIPFRDPNGNLLGVIRRRLDNVFPRYLYPKGFDRIGSIFGSWRFSGRKVYLVEGSLDVVKTDQNGLPAGGIYGSSVNQRQVELLRRLGIKEIGLLFDYDEAGLKAYKHVPELLDGFIVTKVMWDRERFCPLKDCMCERTHRPDPGSIDSETLLSFKEELVGRSPVEKKFYRGRRTNG